MGHGPCQTFIESCSQGVLQTERAVIQPESSGWGPIGPRQIIAIQPLSKKFKCFFNYKLNVRTGFLDPGNMVKDRKTDFLSQILKMDGWMNGVLGHFYALSRLNWAGDNLGKY